MPAKGRMPSIIRLLRFMAVAALMIALAAIVVVMNGDPNANGQTLIAASVALGFLALSGMALSLYAYQQKDRNDPRT